MKQNLPVQPSERSDILDILRGFALLGILLANSAVFSFYIMRTPEQKASLATADADIWLTWIHFIFVDGKFYSLFSLLFGIGFSIIFFRNKAKGVNGLAVFYRRLFFLFLIGLAHSFLLWEGDILMFYAVIGLFLPLFRNVSDRYLLIIAWFLIFSPLLFDLVKVFTEGRWDMSKPFLERALARDGDIGVTEQNVSSWLLVNKEYRHFLQWNTSGFWWNLFFRISSNRPVKVLAMFLLGLYVGRNMIYARLEQYRAMLKRVQLLGLSVGIPAGFLHAYFQLNGKRLPDPAGLWDTFFYAVNVAPLSLAYASTIALFYLNRRHLSILNPLRHVGRMALTNYLMQSLMAGIIYYGIGFGLARNAGPAMFMPLAFVIFFIQVLYSKIWMKYFNYGPVEWVWRQLTYLKRLPLVRRNTG